MSVDLDLGEEPSSARCLSESSALGQLRVSPAERERAFRLIQADVLATLKDDLDRVLRQLRRELGYAPGYGDSGPNSYIANVAERLQQWIHDNFVDTSWPLCPLHGQHPLFLDEEERLVWKCLELDQEIAPLGALGRDA